MRYLALSHQDCELLNYGFDRLKSILASIFPSGPASRPDTFPVRKLKTKIQQALICFARYVKWKRQKSLEEKTKEDEQISSHFRYAVKRPAGINEIVKYLQDQNLNALNNIKTGLSARKNILSVSETAREIKIKTYMAVISTFCYPNFSSIVHKQKRFKIFFRA